jgi:dGTPase
MDWADDVAYAVHDLSDFYKAGIIPLEQLLTPQSRERGRFIDHIKDELDLSVPPETILDFLDDIADPTLRTSFTGSREDRRNLDYFVSTLIQRYMGVENGGVKLQNKEVSPYLHVDERLEQEVEFLKHLTVYYAIEKPELKAQQRGQRQVVSELFDIFFKSISGNKDGIPSGTDIIPTQFQRDAESIREDFNEKRCSRLVADIITSMTEKQAVRMHERLTGTSQGTLQESIID